MSGVTHIPKNEQDKNTVHENYDYDIHAVSDTHTPHVVPKLLSMTVPSRVIICIQVTNPHVRLTTELVPNRRIEIIFYIKKIELTL